MTERLVLWAIFSVGIALVPLVFKGVSLITKEPIEGEGNVIIRGELLLITVALCAAAVGELLASGPSFQLVKIISGGASIIILLFSSLYFAQVSALYADGTQVRVKVVRLLSLGFSGLTLYRATTTVCLLPDLPPRL